MSVYACLGSDAAAIRDAFLTRLQSRTEDMRIKVTILEFLTVAVETQPGLIELFLNLKTKDGSDGAKVRGHRVSVMVNESEQCVIVSLCVCVGVFSGRVELFVCGAGVVGLEAAGEVLVSSAPAQGGTGLPPRALAGQTGERALGAQDQVSRTHDAVGQCFSKVPVVQHSTQRLPERPFPVILS